MSEAQAWKKQKIMKRFIFIFILLFGLTRMYAQTNAIKIGVLGAAIGDYSIGIEQLMHSDYSVNVNVGYWDMKAGLIDFHRFFDEGQDVWLKKGGAGWHGSIEMRTYFDFRRNREFKRFYYGPYFRFWNNSLLLNDYITNAQVNQQLFDVKAKFLAIGIGMQLGYQLKISEKVWVDFYFLGLGPEHITMKAEYNVAEGQGFQYENIEADVRSAFVSQRDIIKKNLEVWTTPDALNIKLPVWLPGMRVGINLAYNF